MAATYNFPSIYQGDTFTNRSITITINTIAVDLTGATVTLELTSKDKKKVIKSVPITITDPINGVITIGSWDVDIKDYIYLYEFKINKADNSTLTYMVGEFPVLNSI